jgi:hypothetical protein
MPVFLCTIIHFGNSASWLLHARMHKPRSRMQPAAAASDALCCALESARVTSLGI